MDGATRAARDCSSRKIVVLYLEVIKVATITTQGASIVPQQQWWAASAVAEERKLASHPWRAERPAAEAPEIASLGDQRL